jgi:hypothetical protein
VVLHNRMMELACSFCCSAPGGVDGRRLNVNEVTNSADFCPVQLQAYGTHQFFRTLPVGVREGFNAVLRYGPTSPLGTNPPLAAVQK